MWYMMAKGDRERPGRLVARLKHEWQNEEGTLAIFALFLFMLMVMMGGVAVDLMRYEATRTSLQNTLDRATLAAASLSQTLDSEDVVIDYFAKAGLSHYLTGVNVTEGLNFREVIADAKASTDPKFVHLIGIDQLDAPGHSKAEQRMNNVEIVLALDVSGSMANNSRLVNLQNAAKEFVDTVLSSDSEHRISIAIVPFNGQVNLGSALLAKFNTTNAHGVANVNCVDLPTSVYSVTSVTPTVSLPMTAHADTFSTTNKVNGYVDKADGNYGVPVAANRWCPPSTANTVTLPSDSITSLQARINGLTAIGATSINAGMKWAMTMLDPTSRPMFTQFASANQIPADFSGRPFDYTDPESMKIIVLMTDGEHFAEERVADAYKTGTSTVYKSPYDGNYSIRFTTGRPGIAGTREYWVPHRSEWRALPWTNTSDTGAATLAPITWQQLWSEVRLQWVVWQLYARAIGTNDSQRNAQWNTWLPVLRTQTATTTMDTQLQNTCNLAKSNGVTVYGIAFEAPVNGQAAISNCATSSAHYFNASGLQIRTAFRAIANNISHLRLTQ